MPFFHPIRLHSKSKNNISWIFCSRELIQRQDTIAKRTESNSGFQKKEKKRKRKSVSYRETPNTRRKLNYENWRRFEIRHCTHVLKETENRTLISRGAISEQINGESEPRYFPRFAPLTTIFSLSSNRVKQPFPSLPFSNRIRKS